MTHKYRSLALVMFAAMCVGVLLNFGNQLTVTAQANDDLVSTTRCPRIVERIQALISRQQNTAALQSNLYQQIINAATEVAEGSLLPQIKAEEINTELAPVITQFAEYKAAVVQLDQSWETVLSGFCEKSRLDIVAGLTDARAQVFQLRSRTQELNKLINSQLHPKLESIIYPNGNQTK
jgi:hypothetical protein